jgi:pilus assembly protein Flp/PilA
MLDRIVRVLKREEGATAIEYGLLAALIALVIIVVVVVLGTNLSGVFGSLASSIPAGG